MKAKKKPPLSISTTPSHTKGIYKAFKGLSSVSGLNSQNLTEKYSQNLAGKHSHKNPKPPTTQNNIFSKHSNNTQPKQKYMSFLKK